MRATWYFALFLLQQIHGMNMLIGNRMISNVAVTYQLLTNNPTITVIPSTTDPLLVSHYAKKFVHYPVRTYHFGVTFKPCNRLMLFVHLCLPLLECVNRHFPLLCIGHQTLFVHFTIIFLFTGSGKLIVFTNSCNIHYVIIATCIMKTLLLR